MMIRKRSAFSEKPLRGYYMQKTINLCSGKFSSKLLKRLLYTKNFCIGYQNGITNINFQMAFLG